jgi:hypothetical protein
VETSTSCLTIDAYHVRSHTVRHCGAAMRPRMLPALALLNDGDTLLSIGGVQFEDADPVS